MCVEERMEEMEQGVGSPCLQEGAQEWIAKKDGVLRHGWNGLAAMLFAEALCSDVGLIAGVDEIAWDEDEGENEKSASAESHGLL